jgi:RNA polymerase sigma-70 factor (sigma-E family)
MSTAKAAAATDFDGFYQAHFGDTVAMTFSYTADLAEAQDIAQEAFSRAWQRWAAVSKYDNPLSWVRRVATNLAHSRWRRVKVATAYLIRQRIEDLPELSPDSVDVVTALKRLPVAQRKAIVLYYLMDLPIEDVAEELGAPAGTVKSWLHRGRASLSTELGDEVRRAISPSPPEQLRDRADKQKRNRRTITTATSIVTAIALILAAVGLRNNLPHPQPPATPSPSPTVNPSPDGLPYNCVGQPLPVPEGFIESTTIGGGDPTARFLTGKVKKGNQTRLTIWADGELQAAFEMPGSSVDLRDVNSKGKAVGTSSNSDGLGPYTSTAWVYDGKLTALPGTNNTAYAINETGTIVGSAQDKPAVWRPGKTVPELLSMPPGEKYGFARDITEDGIIVGVIGESPSDPAVNTGNTRSVAWYPDGSRRDLSGPDGTQKFTRVMSAAGDWAVGSTYGVGVIMTGIRWNLRTGQAEAFEGEGYRTNAQGWSARGNSVRSRLASVTITPSPEGIYANGLQVMVMSDDGRILAGELYGTKTGQFGAVVTWRCAVDR